MKRSFLKNRVAPENSEDVHFEFGIGEEGLGHFLDSVSKLQVASWGSFESMAGIET